MHQAGTQTGRKKALEMSLFPFVQMQSCAALCCASGKTAELETQDLSRRQAAGILPNAFTPESGNKVPEGTILIRMWHDKVRRCECKEGSAKNDRRSASKKTWPRPTTYGPGGCRACGFASGQAFENAGLLRTEFFSPANFS